MTSYFTRVESVLNQCTSHVLTGVTDQEKLDLSKAVKEAFEALEKAIEAHQDVDLDKYDVLWHKSLDILSSNSVSRLFLGWVKQDHIDFTKEIRTLTVQSLRQKQKDEFLADSLKSTLLSRKISLLDQFRMAKKERLLQKVAASARLAFRNQGTSQQVTRVFENTNRICNYLEGNIITNLILRIFYPSRYKVFQKSFNELKANRKIIKKSIDIGLHPQHGNKHKDLLYTSDHVFERMKYFGHKFTDSDQPAFDVVKSYSCEQVFNSCGLFNPEHKKLKELYDQHRQHGYIEVRGSFSDGLYKRYYFKDITFEELKNIVLPSDVHAREAAKNNIKFKLVSKNVDCEELVKQNVLSKKLDELPFSQYFIPTGNFKRDREALKELYISFKAGEFEIQVKKTKQKKLPKLLAKALGPGKTQDSKSEDYEVGKISADKFAKLICPRPGVYRDVIVFDPNKTHYRVNEDDKWTFTGDGFVQRDDKNWTQLEPAGRTSKPPKQFTVECIVYVDSDKPGLSDAGHASLRLTTPNGEEYSVGFFPANGFEIDDLRLQSGYLTSLDYYIFVPHRQKKAVFHLNGAEDFRKLVSWIEAEQKKSREDKLPYHPVYRSCSCFVRDAIGFMKKNCRHKQIKRIGSTYKKVRETVRQYALETFLRMPFIKSITRIDEDMTSIKQARQISLREALGDKSKLPFLPALLMASN